MKSKVISLACAALAFAACSQQQQPQQGKVVGLDPEKFGTALVDSQEVKLFTLTNANTGMLAQFTNVGAKLVSLYVADKNDVFEDVVLGYATAAEYADCDNEKGIGEPFFGATVGRYGNRIAGGKFSIDGEEYQLCLNEGNLGNSLHGGYKGYFAVVWEANQIADNKIEFSRVDPDGFMGYPGNLNVKITYELCDCNSLKISYSATTDKPTICNITHHSFFNLAGEKRAQTVNDQFIQIAADYITAVDGKLIPTGELMPVAGTPFDFNTARLIGDSLQSEHPQVKLGNGYDHNWVLSAEPDSTGLRFAAQVTDTVSGRQMTVLTTEPGIQFYGGNFMGSQTGKSGNKYPYRAALCLETQHFPDSPNHENFPSTVLRPGETYSHVCVYKFGVVK